MPIILVKGLPQKSGVDVRVALKETCTRLAEMMDIPKRQVWGTWEDIEPGSYVEGDVAADTQPENSHPPIVNVIAFEGRSPDLIRRALNCVAESLGEKLGVGENIFIRYTEAKSGRVWDGGRIVESK